MFNKIIVTLAISGLFCGVTYAQPTANGVPAKYQEAIPKMKTKELKKKAAELYETRNFEAAYPYLKALAEAKPKDLDVAMELGEAAMYVRDYETAYAQFKKVAAKKPDDYTYLHFHYGNALKMKAMYTEALKEFEAFLKTNTDPKDKFVISATKQLEACARAADLASSGKSIYTVKNMGKGVNTPADEYSAGINDSLKLFLFTTQDAKGNSINVLRDNKPSSAGDMSNPDRDAGAPFVASNGTTVYFSRLQYTANGEGEYKLFSGTLAESGEIQNIKRLGSSINRDGFNSTHPCMAIEDKGQEVLYFASTQPGGEGGYDLWYAVKMTNGEFTQSWNMGRKLNSLNDEITPYFYQQSKTLFFSSNREEGFGGYDIYRANGDKKYWTNPIPFTSPLNSAADDYYFILRPNGTGYFSSNRSGEGAEFQSYPNCCDDIYSVEKN